MPRPASPSEPEHHDTLEPSILARILRDMVENLRADDELPAALVAALESDGGVDLLSDTARTQAAIEAAVGVVEP